MTHGRSARLLGGAAVLAALVLLLAPASALAKGQAKAVYVMTNATHNRIMIFKRASSGSLTYVSSVATYGRGTGTNLASQGAIALSSNGHWLFACNAVSNSISVFRVSQNGHLKLTDVAPSDGTMPISLTVHGNVIYVLNDGFDIFSGPGTRSDGQLIFPFGNIAGLRLNCEGELTPIVGSEQPLGVPTPIRSRVAIGVFAAQISFNPAGTLLVVTEKAANFIDTYTLDTHRRAQPPVAHTSAGHTPFGFAFSSPTAMIVAESELNVSNASTVSSYDVSPSTFTTVSTSVPDLQTGASGLIVTPSRKYAYVANSASDSISSYSIGAGGTIALLTSQAGVGPGGSKPIDMAFGHGSSRLIYVLCPGNGSVEVFTVAADGSLTSVYTQAGLLSSVSGLAAW